MLIFQIAAGIVLGVLALAALPLVFRALPYVIGLVLLLAGLVAVIIFLIVGLPDSLYVCLGVSAFVAFAVWTHKDKRFDIQERQITADRKCEP
jgi:putative Ca2+/H+ antiporter (TMEM165/GDT1 family)